ncbi:hypothetical protein AHAS_Ahas09G0136900 [Arachis hypogaea]
MSPIKLLKELAHFFDLCHSCLDTWYGKIKITPTKIRDVLGLNATRNFCFYCFLEKVNITDELKEVVESFKGSSLSYLIKSLLEINLEGDENQLKFKRTFILFIQKCFLLPTIARKIFSVHMPAILDPDNT